MTKKRGSSTLPNPSTRISDYKISSKQHNVTTVLSARVRISFIPRCLPVEVGAPSDAVVGEVFGVPLVAEVLQGIRPEEVAHRAERRRLLKAVQLAGQRSGHDSVRSGHGAGPWSGVEG